MSLPRTLLLALGVLLVTGLSFAKSGHPLPHRNKKTADDYYMALWKKSPFYLGAITAYGSTDWGMLVISCDQADALCQVDELSLSAPTSAGDDGAVWGVTAGYEVEPFWAIEASFFRFPTSLIHKSKTYSFYDNENDPNRNAANFSTETWAFTLTGKFMTRIYKTGFRGFANAGLDITHRKDIFTDNHRISATFGIGVNYVFQSDVMLELFFQYMAGYGRANEKPITYYTPFLYTLGLKVLYRM